MDGRGIGIRFPLMIKRNWDKEEPIPNRSMQGMNILKITEGSTNVNVHILFVFNSNHLFRYIVIPTVYGIRKNRKSLFNNRNDDSMKHDKNIFNSYFT